MGLSNYGQLKTAVAARLSRSNMTSLIPDFIGIAHFKMMRGDYDLGMPALRMSDMLTTSTLTLSDGAASLPADYLEAKRIYVDTSETPAISYIPPEKWYGLQAQGQAGIPAFYTIEGSTIRCAPYGAYDLKLYYYAALDALSDDADTNAIFTKGPHAYLYGALSEAYDHIRQHDRAQMYGKRFASAVRSLNEDSQQAMQLGDVLTMRADKVV